MGRRSGIFGEAESVGVWLVVAVLHNIQSGLSVSRAGRIMGKRQYGGLFWRAMDFWQHDAAERRGRRMNKRKIWRRYGLALVLILALSGCRAADEDVPVPEEKTFEGENSIEEQAEPAGQPVLDVDAVLAEQMEEEEDGQEEESVSQEMSWAVAYAVDGKALSDTETAIYNALKDCITEVARGERETTQFSLSTAFSKEQLSQIDVNTIVFYLLNDCPFDLFWHDKTMTTEAGKPVDGVYCQYTDGKVEFTFKVSAAYRKSPDNLYQVNGAYLDKVRHAYNKAQAIVDASKNSSDYDKLVAYKNAVCDLVAYDTAALAAPDYGDAYQVISVFDEDPNTNVVCEGYAKAFKYLCDLTAFDHDVQCYVVSGTSDSGQGAGEHMWNVIRTGGESYMVDVTNCDAGTIGADYELFLADNPAGSVDSGYTFYCNGWAPITYTYNADPRTIFGATILTLGNASHNGLDSLHNQGNGGQPDIPGTGTENPPAPAPEPTPTPEPTPAPTPTPDSSPTQAPTNNTTANPSEQKPEKEEKTAEKPTEKTAVLSFDVTDVQKTYGDGAFTETVSGAEENSKITYKSSDESVAIIGNKKGKVRILKPGTTTITATDSEGGSTASYKLTVAKKPLTWDVSGMYAVDQKNEIGSAAEATLFGEMTIEGILESDKDQDSRFSFNSNDLTGTYVSTVVGTQKVTLNWKEGKKRTLNGEKANYYELPDTLPQLTGKITSTTELETPPESTDHLMLELEMEDSISQVPEAFLEDKSLDLNTPAKIEEALFTKVQEWDSAISDDNIAVYDVTLRSLDKASDNETDEGEWVKVTDERFPEEGVTVTLPYPKGTSGRMQDFVVCHMFAEDMYLSSPGEVEYPEVTETAEGIQFKVYGLSPIAVGWTNTRQSQPQAAEDGSTQEAQDTDSQKQKDQDPGIDQDKSLKSPAVLGSSGELRSLIFAAVILLIIAIILAIRLRKNKD